MKVKVEAAAVEADSDGDGIPDSKDTSDEGNVIALNADEGTAAAQADEGVSIVVVTSQATRVMRVLALQKSSWLKRPAGKMKTSTTPLVFWTSKSKISLNQVHPSTW